MPTIILISLLARVVVVYHAKQRSKYFCEHSNTNCCILVCNKFSLPVISLCAQNNEKQISFSIMFKRIYSFMLTTTNAGADIEYMARYDNYRGCYNI